MFTGLIEEVGHIQNITKSGTGVEIEVQAVKVLEGTATGDSIALDGACQTVTSLGSDSFTVFASQVTLDLTILGSFKRGSRVNLERALTLETRLGGHLVQGHVDGRGTISDIKRDSSGIALTVKAGPDIMKYLAAKGSVSVNGISLTVVSSSNDSFSLYIIPETLGITTLDSWKPGDEVNIEVDVLARYVEQILKHEPGSSDASLMEKLGSGGFL